jgi:hypothetical protein
MRPIACILLATLLLAPAVCAACDLQIATNISPEKDVKHYSGISCYVDAFPSDFYSAFWVAMSMWQKEAAIGIYEGGGDTEMEVSWLDTAEDPWDPEDPNVGCADTRTSVDGTTGEIIHEWIKFPSNLLNYSWYWYDSCPEPACAINIYEVMRHEIGHALGFCIGNPHGVNIVHPSSGSVMSSPLICHTELQATDKACAQYLYPASGISRCAEFAPVLSGSGVSIKWQTEYEYETSRFVLEKKQSDGLFATIGEPIMSAGSAHAGANYEYFDPTGMRSDTYRLMEVDKSGSVLGTAQERVVLKEPSGSSPIVLSDVERTELQKDIAATLEGQISEKTKALKAPMSGEITWLAICPAAFVGAITPLVTYRQYHGYNATWATYEYVLSSYGTMKAYLQYLWNSQGHALKYVLIVGDGEQIPAVLCDDGDVGGGFYAHYRTDIPTVDLAGDWRPEVSVGRIPAASADEVSLYVAKVLEYEGQAAADWNNHVTYFIEDRDGGFNYQSGPVAAKFAEELAELIPPARTLHYENMLAHLPYNQCSQRSLAIGEFNAGRGTVLAFGSMAAQWDFVGWLRTLEIYEGCAFAGTQLAENHRYAFVLGASCDIGSMYAGMNPWLLKELLFQRYSGAIAGFAPTGATWQLGDYDVSAGILNRLYNWGTPTVGYACYSAQKDAMEAELPGNAHSARSFIFYGDPAIKLKGSITGAAPVVTVTDPNGGESYSTPGPIPITWNVQDDDLGGIRCTVLINYDGGSGIWSVLATGVPVDAYGHGSYNYHIGSGNITYTHCLVQVFARDACNNEGIDVSDGEFTVHLITPPPKPGEPIPIDPTSALATIPKENYLGAPFPNPFNPITTIGFGLKAPSRVALTIYDVTGAVVKSLCRNELLQAGIYTRRWNGTNDRGVSVSSGIYFLQMKAESYSETRRLILLR